MNILETIPAGAIVSLIGCFTFNFLITGILIYFLYFKKTERRDFLFTFFMVSSIIFLMIFMLNNVNMQVGFALGLFAIFGILRYRTDTLPVREMTYLFVIIGISVINALSNWKENAFVLIVANLILIAIAYILESKHLVKHTSTKLIIYEKISLAKPKHKEEMLADLTERTGLDIQRFEIGQIDFLKDIAFVKIYYTNNGEINTADPISKISQCD